jgi:hypothetical protein
VWYASEGQFSHGRDEEIIPRCHAQVFSDIMKRSLEQNGIPEFNYRSRKIFAFKTLPGTDEKACIFGMSVREFGPSTPSPNRSARAKNPTVYTSIHFRQRHVQEPTVNLSIQASVYRSMVCCTDPPCEAWCTFALRAALSPSTDLHYPLVLDEVSPHGAL